MARTNEEQLDLFADLLEPVGEILADKNLADTLKTGRKIDAIKLGIKNHKQSIIRILALTEGTDVDSYVVPSPTVLALKIISMLNKPEVSELFTQQGQNETGTVSGSATGSTGVDVV